MDIEEGYLNAHWKLPLISIIFHIMLPLVLWSFSKDATGNWFKYL